MRMRHAVLFAALPAVLALAACGSDDDGATSTTVPPADTQPTGAGGFDYATGPDDVVLQVSQEGGFVPAGFVFTATPMLSITGDGHVFTPGVMTMQYPGPLVAPTSVQTITPEGIEAVLALAAEHELLATPPVYPRNDMVADAPDTVVTLTVGGETFEHRAYALGIVPDDGTESDPARANLAAFVEQVVDLSAVVPEGSLSAPEPFVAAAYEIQAMPADASNVEGASEVAWASDSGISLAAATECASVPDTDVAATALLLGGTQATFFTEDGVTYQVFARPHLPGGPAC